MGKMNPRFKMAWPLLLGCLWLVLRSPCPLAGDSPKEGLFDPRTGASTVFPQSRLPVYPAGMNAPEQIAPELISGTWNCLVIVIKAADKSFSFSAATFSDMLNGPWATGSMKDYFMECSYGLFSVSGAASGWYTAVNSYSYYSNFDGLTGTNDDYGLGAYPHNAVKLVEEAVDAAEAAGVDFAQFDNDGDGSAESIFIVHQGQGAEGTSNPNDIWSHKWSLSGGGGTARFYDGKWINIYTIEPEISSCVSGAHIEIGVFCHEYGHAIGLPDLYDTDGSGYGVGRYCLMGNGSWGGSGCTPHKPSLLSAWCKAKLSWVVPTVVALGGPTTLPQIETNPRALKLWKNGAPATEYFLLENRQKVGFDVNLPGSGLLIWHIDDSKTTNRYERCGSCSTSSNPIAAVVQADGLCNLECKNNSADSGDPFPGSTHNLSFSHSSTPSSDSYGGTDSLVSVTSIIESAANMTMDIRVGFLGYYVLDGYGGVHAGGGASNFVSAPPYFGWDIARDLELNPASGGGYILDGYGGLHAAGGAAAISPPTPYFGWDIARTVELNAAGAGYYVLDGFGGIHHGGSAPAMSPATPYFGWDIAKDLELNAAGTGGYVLDGYGGVHAGGGAGVLAPASPYFGWNIARDLELTPAQTGYYVLEGYGGIHRGGTASVLGTVPPYFGWDIAKRFCLAANGTVFVVLDGYGGLHVGSTGAAAETLPSPATPYFGWNIARDIKLAYSSGS